jgi:hypothetical protein
MTCSPSASPDGALDSDRRVGEVIRDHNTGMLRSLLARTGLAGYLGRLWRPDVDDALKPVRKDLRLLISQVEGLKAALAETQQLAARADRMAAQVKLAAVLNREQRQTIADAGGRLDPARVGAHVRSAIESATMCLEPYEHMVVDNLLPPDLYDLLIESIPPEPFFDYHDPIKRNLRFPMDLGPTLSDMAWGFFDEVVTAQMIRPAVLDRFHEPLQHYYDAIFGEEHRGRANDMPLCVNSGRLMLRRRGYHLDPHRDPKHSVLTCLVYFARPGDDEAHGTQIFSVADDTEADYKQTYYPEQAGHPCTLVKVVPFRPNSLLVFLNSRGAHGASIPNDAPESLARYSYQFYIGPKKEALGALIRQLPEARRRLWQAKGNRDQM